MPERFGKTGRASKRRVVYAAVGVFTAAAATICIAASAQEDSKAVKSKSNEFKPAVIENAVQENGDGNSEPTNSNELTLDKDGKTDKKVQILNVDSEDENNADAYIRVCIIPRWVCVIDGQEIDVTNSNSLTQTGDPAEIEISNNSYTLGDITFKLDSNWAANWFLGEDGYFYCNHIVKPGEATEALLESVTVDDGLLDSMSDMSDSFYLKVDVISDSIQTVGGAVEARWNAVQINGKKLEKKQAEDSSENAGEEETAKEAENTAEEKDS